MSNLTNIMQGRRITCDKCQGHACKLFLLAFNACVRVLIWIFGSFLQSPCRSWCTTILRRLLSQSMKATLSQGRQRECVWRLLRGSSIFTYFAVQLIRKKGNTERLKRQKSRKRIFAYRCNSIHDCHLVWAHDQGSTSLWSLTFHRWNSLLLLVFQSCMVTYVPFRWALSQCFIHKIKATVLQCLTWREYRSSLCNRFRLRESKCAHLQS